MEIFKLYEEIFDNNGEIKPCGRDKCRCLIKLFSDRYPDINFGDEETGFMNIENIKKFMKM